MRRYCQIVLAVGVAGLVGIRVCSAQPATAGSAKPQSAAAYVIGPADVLQINVWKEPDLTRDVTVRFDGMVTMPLVGDIRAAGRAPGELAQALARELARFIETPRVTVGVSQATSARFYVIGQVTKSGEFLLTGPMTALQGLALAGGFQEYAKPENIVIVRQDQTVVPVNYKRIADGRDVSQNVFLGAGDTIVVP